MKIWVDFYKPTGKFYAGGAVEMEEVQAHHGPQEKLAIIWKNQKVLIQNTDQHYWTIVTDDLDINRHDPNYREMWKRVLQIGQE